MISAQLFALCGALLVAGLFALIFGMRRTEQQAATSVRQVGGTWARVTRRPPGAAGRRRDQIALMALLGGVVITAATGWVVSLVAIPVLVLGLPRLLSQPRNPEVPLLEALDRWVRTLSATLPTGKSITDAIRLSRRTAPELLAEPLGVLIRRLNHRWDTREALVRFADDLNSPDADAVVAALILAAQRGSNGATATLEALADSVQTQLRARRVIETERAKPYIVVRQITAITLGTLGLAFVLASQFFRPYGSPLGQLVLGILLSLYALSLVLMRRRATPRQRSRILAMANR